MDDGAARWPCGRLEQEEAPARPKRALVHDPVPLQEPQHDLADLLLALPGNCQPYAPVVVAEGLAEA